MTPFGEKLRQLRAARGVDQATMAAALGVSAAYMSALEHGKKGAPSWALTQKIIQYFGLIWDDAEDLQTIAQFSKPRVTINTAGLDPKATRAVNVLSKRVGHLSFAQLDALLDILESHAEKPDDAD